MPPHPYSVYFVSKKKFHTFGTGEGPNILFILLQVKKKKLLK
jgi:hypothetical protein